MALDTDMFAEDFLVAQEDLPTEAAFEDFSVDGIFQKVNQQETPMMAGIEDNSSAVIYVSVDELGSNDVDIGDKCTINLNQYRVLAINPYQHGKIYRFDLTDENS